MHCNDTIDMQGARSIVVRDDGNRIRIENGNFQELRGVGYTLSFNNPLLLKLRNMAVFRVSPAIFDPLHHLSYPNT
jgi:hypothetical protein